MNKLSFITWLCILCTLALSMAYAKNLESGTFSNANSPFASQFNTGYIIDSGSFTNLPTPRSNIRYYRNFNPLSSHVYDLMEEITGAQDSNDRTEQFTRAFLLLNSILLDSYDFVLLNPHTFLATSGIETVHEYAHRTRSANIHGRDTTFNTKYNPIGDNPFSLTLGLITQNNKTGSAIWKDGKTKIRFTPDDTIASPLQRDFIAFAAGINQQVNLAVDMANRVSLSNQLDVAQFFSYYWNSLAYFAYNDDVISFISSGFSANNLDDEVGDRNQMHNAWWRDKTNSLNNTLKDSELSENQLYSFLLSGTTWSYLLGIKDYILTGQRLHKPLRLGNFRLPDFFNYYQINGPTLAIKSDYRLSPKTFIRFGYERIYTGNHSGDDEFTLGLSKAFLNRHELHFNLHHNNKTSKQSYDIEWNFHINKNMALGLGFNSMHFDTFVGERDIHTIKDGRSDKQLYGNISYYFH